MIKSKSMAAAAAALAMCMAGSAFAQDHRFDRGPERNDRAQPGYRATPVPTTAPTPEAPTVRVRTDSTIAPMRIRTPNGAAAGACRANTGAASTS